MKKALRITLIVLVVAIVLVAIAGWVAYRNARRIAEWAIARALPGTATKISELQVSTRELVANRVTVAESAGAPILEAESLRVEFTPGDLWRRKIDVVTLVQPTIFVSQDATSRWNFQRLSGQNEPRAVGQKVEKPPRSFHVGQIKITSGQIVLGDNLFARGVAPIQIDLTAQDVDTAHLDTIAADGSVRLPACDVKLHDHPVALHGLQAEMQLKGSTVEGRVIIPQLTWKDAVADSVSWNFQASQNSVQFTNITANFYGSPVTGFGAFHLNASPMWYNAGLELNRADMEKISAAMSPEMFRATGTSYLYLEAVGNVQELVTWASFKFKTESSGTLFVKDLPKLLAASSMPPDKQQLFLLAFDHGETLPYKSAWLNADVHARTLTIATYLERQAKWFFGLEVQPPPFEIPMDVLKQRGWLP